MEKQRTIVLYGSSVLMDRVEANLSKQLLGVLRIHTIAKDIEERLRHLCPDLVIFDLDTPHSQFVIPFLKDQPGTTLLGLDADCGKVIALSSQHYTTLAM